MKFSYYKSGSSLQLSILIQKIKHQVIDKDCIGSDKYAVAGMHHKLHRFITLAESKTDFAQFLIVC